MLKNKNIEKRILIHLLENGNQSISQIAKDIGVTRQTVAKKLESMYKSGLMSSPFPKLEPERFGLTTQAYIFMKEDPRSDIRKRNEEIIKSFSQVCEFHRIFGEYSSIIKVLVKDNKELTEFVKKLQDLKAVRETETFIVHSTLKNKPEDPFKRILLEEK